MNPFRKLTQPPYPNAAVGLTAGGASVVALERKRGGFRLRQGGYTDFAAGLITPNFEDTNLHAPDEIAETLRELAATAGLARQTRWSATLPDAATRTTILTMEGDPSSGSELEEMLKWKVERAFHYSLDELRVARRRLSPDEAGRPRYLASAVRLTVLAEYEVMFQILGWQAGLILPRHIGEAAWLMQDSRAGDSLLISSHDEGFTAILLRAGEPFIIRTVVCDPASATDELYRLLLFYRDRVAAPQRAGEPDAQSAADSDTADVSTARTIERVLLVGGVLNEESSYEVICDTLGVAPHLMRPEDVSLNLPATDIHFDHIAAPAGLAALA